MSPVAVGRPAVIAAAMLLLGAGLGQAQIHAGFPVPSRLFTTQSLLRTPAQVASRRLVRAVSVEVAVLRLSRGDDPGSPDPDGPAGLAGARLGVELLAGLWQFGAEAIEDSRRDLESEAFPAQVHAANHVPALRTTVRVALGIDDDGIAGGDGVLELPAWAVPDRTSDRIDFRPTLNPWIRVRQRRGDPRPVFTPAVSVAVPHVPSFGSGLPLGATLLVDTSGRALPASRVLFQLGYAGAGRRIAREDPDAVPVRGGRMPFQGTWAPIAGVSYALPLDGRGLARFTLTAGVTFDLPITR